MSSTLIAFLVALSASVWIYNKLMRTTGGNTKNAATAAGIAAVMIFVLVLLLTRLIPA